MAFSSALPADQVILLKGRSVFLLLTRLSEHKRRQDGEAADERVSIICVQKNTLFFLFAGWTEELTKDTEYLLLTPISGGRQGFPVSHVKGRRQSGKQFTASEQSSQIPRLNYLDFMFTAINVIPNWPEGDRDVGSDHCGQQQDNGGALSRPHWTLRHGFPQR